RFLMHELQRLFTNHIVFPTLKAEDLAARYLMATTLAAGTSPNRAAAPVLSPAPLAGVWHFASHSGRVVLLLEAETLPARMASWVPGQTLPADVRLALNPPGKQADKSLLSTPAGA